MKAGKVTRSGNHLPSISDEDYQALEKAAESRRMTKAAIVRFAIENVLRDMKPSNSKTRHLGLLTPKR
jgi:hypothetical protein